ncbi:hypothetical protein JW887_00905, partial [Candidatus Dojkabacteria bacterium]|nr:hypothetical protein [Candidatus Dojkabacteria bacterium]
PGNRIAVHAPGLVTEQALARTVRLCGERGRTPIGNGLNTPQVIVVIHQKTMLRSSRGRGL